MIVCGRPDRSLREARTTAIPQNSRSSDQVLRKVTVGFRPQAAVLARNREDCRPAVYDVEYDASNWRAHSFVEKCAAF